MVPFSVFDDSNFAFNFSRQFFLWYFIKMVLSILSIASALWLSFSLSEPIWFSLYVSISVSDFCTSLFLLCNFFYLLDFPYFNALVCLYVKLFFLVVYFPFFLLFPSFSLYVNLCLQSSSSLQLTFHKSVTDRLNFFQVSKCCLEMKLLLNSNWNQMRWKLNACCFIHKRWKLFYIFV